MQRAQPMYLSHYWLAYFSMFQRDIERLQDSWKRVNVSPLGACALIGTTFATNKHYTAELLGFDGIYPNTLDAVSDRDFVVEFLAASALIMVHISRLSEELILWSSQEFNFISFADAYCTGSSIMPQKKNPDVVELARGKTGRVYGALIALLTILKGLPLAYNKDLQEDKEPLFDTVKTVSQTLMIFVPLLASLQVNKTAMRAAVTEGYLNATALAEHLVRVGLTFREAHEVVGKMVSFCISKNCQLEALTLAEMQQFADCLDEKVYSILVPENIVQAYGNGEIMEIQPFEAAVLANQTWIVEKVMLLEKVGNGLG
jgi:argininosuccinate lyase